MNRSSFLAITAVLASALAGACANNMPFDPDDPRLDGAQLVIVGEAAVNLQYGEMANLRVRYEAADGQPIDGAPIGYEIVGTASGGSRLAALSTVSDIEGLAGMDLTAGSSNAMFDVRVSPPEGGGDPVVFSVAVLDTEAGGIVVTMTYGGDRDLVRFDTFLYQGLPCAGFDPLDLPTALRSAPSVSAITAMPAFAGLPVASDYTVVVAARNGSAIAAFGCRDNIVVTDSANTPVNITLMDTTIPPNFVGVFDLDNRFDFAEGLPPTVRSAIDLLDELTDDHAPEGGAFCVTPPVGEQHYGRDPGAFIVDVLARQTCAWDCRSLTGAAGSPTEPTYENCAALEYPVNNHRLGDLSLHCTQTLGSPTAPTVSVARFPLGCGGWDVVAPIAADEINDLLESFIPDFVTQWAMLVGDLSRAINNARIGSVLTIRMPGAGNEFDLPVTHELVTMTVVLHDPFDGGAERTFTFSLADAGVTNLALEETITVDGAVLTIPDHSFTLSFGRLVQYIYTELILGEILGYTSSAMMLEDLINCMTLGETLAMTVGGLSATQYENACDTGITLIGGLLDTQIAGLIDADASFTISGTTTGTDIDESTGRVDTLSNGVWTGFWGERSMTSDLAGTFTGVRRSGG